MHWLGRVVVVLALIEGGWLAFDGGRALVVGDYVTPESGPYAGQLGPWAKVVSAVGIEPRSTLMKSIHLVLGRHRYVSAALVLLGLLLAAVCVAQFRRTRTTVNPMSPDRTSAVVTSGLYRVSRNPMYLGMALVLLGVAAWGSALAGYLLVLGFCWYLTRFQIIPEERALLATFGEEFAQYMSRVRRWV